MESFMIMFGAFVIFMQGFIIGKTIGYSKGCENTRKIFIDAWNRRAGEKGEK